MSPVFSDGPGTRPGFLGNGSRQRFSDASGHFFGRGLKWENLRNPSRHIERVINTMSSKEVADNRLHLITTIEAVKFLAEQGCPNRGNDESVDSLNRGNFDAILKFAKRISLDHHEVLNNAPKNAKYTSSTIQKQMVNILGNKVRVKIREEVGESKFCILVDEALDVANKEKMAIILRFVDCKGLVKERFFKLLTLNYVAKEVSDVWQFFSTLTMIVNFVDSSAKRHSMLKSYREEEILDLLAVGTFETGTATVATIDDLYNNGVDKQIKAEAKGIEHGISMPDMSAPYKKGARDNERNITNEHYFRVNILYDVIDLQLMELEKRFPETSMELLGLGASFDPRHGFQAFKAEDVCKLASKFYPCDFTSCGMDNLKMECGFFLDGCEQDSRFTKMTSISDLCRLLVESGNGLGSTRLASSSSSPSAPIFHPKRNNQVADQVRKSEIEMSAVVSSAPWKQLLLRALESNSNLNHSSYFQLATVAPNGRPSNRTVVFRGFEGDSDRIEINTDTRTRKIEELKHCPFAEICWYFTDSWEQFRINGRVDVVDETYPDTSRLQERERSWFASSARSKLQYVGPHPGLPSIGEETPQEANLDPTSSPVSAFCLLVLDPYQVDYLNLKNNQRTSFLSTRSADGQRSWVAENVNP
ncbi:unnamed protein product [Rhodiola kirilowii]